MYYYNYDYMYYSLILIVPALLFGIWAQARISSNYKKYSKIYSSRGLTGAQVARQILDNNGLHDVQIKSIQGELTDHYDPRVNTVSLSTDIYDSTSLAAIGVAAHECGHAIQHGNNYFPLKIRNAIVPITNFGSKLAIPLLLVGLLINSYPLVLVGIFGYALIAIFQLITLPVEFNASSRAMNIIDEYGILNSDEQKGAGKVLKAAALTYVAALVSSIAQLLRLLLMVMGRRN